MATMNVRVSGGARTFLLSIGRALLLSLIWAPAAAPTTAPTPSPTSSALCSAHFSCKALRLHTDEPSYKCCPGVSTATGKAVWFECCDNRPTLTPSFSPSAVPSTSPSAAPSAGPTTDMPSSSPTTLQPTDENQEGKTLHILLAVAGALCVVVFCGAACIVRKVARTQKEHEARQSEMYKQRASQLQGTSKSIIDLQRKMDSFFEELELRDAGGPRVEETTTKNEEAAHSDNTAAQQQPSQPPEDPGKKKERVRKQSQAFTNANAARMFAAFQKLGHGGKGNLDIKDFIALCGGENAAEVRQLFAMLDEDMSGTLEISEIGHALKHNKQAAELAQHYSGLHDLCHLARGRKKRGHVHHKHEIRSIAQFQAFSKLDEDGNGTLDLQEFTAVCVGDDEGANVDEVKKLFALLDEDHSGTINCGELGHVLKHNKRAQVLAKHYAALHDLVHMAHGRKHHPPKKSQHGGHKHHAHEDKSVARFAAFQKLDANGDGSLDFEEFFSVCGGDDRESVRELFDLLDEDLGGTIDVNEIAHALEHNHQARELAKHFDALHDLVDLSKARSHRHHHHKHGSKHHHHKKQHKVVVKEKIAELTFELFGHSKDAEEMCFNHPKLRALAEEDGSKGEKARELNKLYQEEEQLAKKHGSSRRRSKLARRNTRKGDPTKPAGDGSGGAPLKRKGDRSKRHRPSMQRRRTSSQRLVSAMQVAQLNDSQKHRRVRNRWKKVESRASLISMLGRGSGLGSNRQAMKRTFSEEQNAFKDLKQDEHEAQEAQLALIRKKKRGSRAFKSAFAKFDGDGDHQLDLNELLAICGGEDADFGEVSELFNLCDGNEGGTVNVQEMMHALHHDEKVKALARKIPALKPFIRGGREGSRQKRGISRKNTAAHPARPPQSRAQSGRQGQSSARNRWKRSTGRVKWVRRLSGTPSSSSRSAARGRPADLSAIQREEQKAFRDLEANEHANQDAQMARIRQKQKEKRAFKRGFATKLDANGSGDLDFQEFLSVCGEGADEHDVAELFALCDGNEGGTVNVRELMHAFQHDEKVKAMARHFPGLESFVH